MTTSINMSSCFENPQSALISAFKQKNIDAFKYALEHLHADPNLDDPRFGKTIFEKILETPKSSDFIILCIDNGADLYLKNADGRYPIHFAIDSFCPENLKAFLKFFDSKNINVKYGNTGMKTSLHVLVDMLPGGDEYPKIAECIKILITNGCNPNIPNEKKRTAFFSLLKIQPKLPDQDELIDFMLDNCSIDISTFKHDETKRMFEKQNPNRKLPEKVEKVIDVEFMLSLLRSSKHSDFEVNFKLFKENSTSKQNNANDDNKSNNFSEDCAKFLYTAVQNDLQSIVEILVAEKVDINKVAADAISKTPPAFLACNYGYHKILSMLLRADPKPETTFEGRSLLHKVCINFGNEKPKNSSVDFQKCFELVVDGCDVNTKDDQGCTPLLLAVRYQNDDAVKALLEKSSYIGSENIYGETPIDDMKREVFEDFLNSLIKTNDRRTGDEEQEITIDYNFLKSPKHFKNEDEYRTEIAPLQKIADNSELRPLILHPVLSSFLFLKWSKLSMLFYMNLVLFSIFMVSLIAYIVMHQSIPVEDRDDDGTLKIFFCISIISVVILMIREIFQCILSPKNYFKSLTNWFEIALIILGWIVLFQSNDDSSTQRSVRALLILCAAYEFLQLVGTLPILSISTHMVILKKVGVTFLKSIALYSIVLFAFAFSFFTLFGGKQKNEENETTAKSVEDKDKCPCKDDDDNDEFNSFGYPGIAIIKTFVMLTGEFDASALKLELHPFYSVIFVLFVFVVTIVLFNLLNALAVDDTQVIKSEGQLVDLCQRINVLYKYERIILSRSGSWRWLKAIISIFPYTIPEGTIVIRPTKDNEILLMRPRQSSRDISIKVEDGQAQELQNLNNNSSLDTIIPRRKRFNLETYSKMDPKIMKKIRFVLDEQKEKRLKNQQEESLVNRIHSMESQLKILTDLIKNQNKP